MEELWQREVQSQSGGERVKLWVELTTLQHVSRIWWAEFESWQ